MPRRRRYRMGQLVVVVALVYFLLVAGDSFRRTLIRISDDTLTKKKITVQILDQIDLQIQRYLLVQLASSALLGVWGLLLGVPIVMAIKAVCERIEDLRPISEFLGYEEGRYVRTPSEAVDVPREK
jgi:predicted PurR-regulated permease PerM